MTDIAHFPRPGQNYPYMDTLLLPNGNYTSSNQEIIMNFKTQECVRLWWRAPRRAGAPWTKERHGRGRSLTNRWRLIEVHARFLLCLFLPSILPTLLLINCSAIPFLFFSLFSHTTHLLMHAKPTIKVTPPLGDLRRLGRGWLFLLDSPPD